MGRGGHVSQQVPRRAGQGMKFPVPRHVATCLPGLTGGVGHRDGRGSESRVSE